MPEAAPHWQPRPARAALAERVRARFRVPYPDDSRLLLSCLCDPTGSRVAGYSALYATLGPEQERGFLLRWGQSDRLDPASAESLLEHSLGRARNAGAAAVKCDQVLPEDGEAAALLTRLGFEARERLETYRPAYRPVLERARRICQAAERRGLRPEAAALDWLRPEHLPLVRARLHQERILSVTELDLKLRAEHDEPIDRERSTLILRHGELLGVMLVAPLADGAGYDVPARWVHPDLRNGWANAALIATSCGKGTELGLTHVQFSGNTARHDETRRLAERLGAEVKSRGARFVRRLDD